ncbi:hypothetical protein OC835_003749 [Tilletia horrida]|uniref:Uncharacterized protein n=1 Tax=Tilletia horrida TaxID=155126 RepID=A0AAN6GBF9_9BASI|nr:hypothetical protein OC835_003749 [Tilletia horrida]KAK0531577.1 hypothetical protein OC842_003578 [Tilletia horrida]
MKLFAITTVIIGTVILSALGVNAGQCEDKCAIAYGYGTSDYNDCVISDCDT